MKLFLESLKEIPRSKLTWGLLFLISALIAEIVMTNLIPTWRQYFFNVLGSRQQSLFSLAIMYYLALVTILTLAQGFKKWLAQKLALHFRTALTNILQYKWLSHKKRDIVDSPDQRINQDTFLATDNTISVALEVIISGVLVILLVGESLAKPQLILASLAYTVIVCIIAMVFKNKLIDTEIGLQKAEAEHRYSLSQLREVNSKLGIQIGSGIADIKYLKVIQNYLKNIAINLKYTLFAASQSNFTPAASYILLAPAFFAGTMTIGSYMGDVALFDLIVVNASILVIVFPNVTRAIASWKRLNTFYDQLEK